MFILVPTGKHTVFTLPQGNFSLQQTDRKPHLVKMQISGASFSAYILEQLQTPKAQGILGKRGRM